MWIVLFETISILRNLQKSTIFGMPQKKFTLGLGYVQGSSSDHLLLTLNLHFKVILWRF